jgi:V/A-type H+/Na+-transporting ATPase subunit A
VSWPRSYSFYADAVAPWWREASGLDWLELRRRAAAVLEQDARLEQMVRLVGADALPDRQRWVVEAAALIREGLLRQDALHPIDAYCEPEKQAHLLALFVDLHDLGVELLERGVPLLRLREALDAGTLTRLKETVPNDEAARIDAAWRETRRVLLALRSEAEAAVGTRPGGAGTEVTP